MNERPDDHATTVAAFAAAVSADLAGRIGPDVILRHLVAVSSLTPFRAGEVIVEQHEAATDLKVLVEGGVTYRHVVNERRQETVEIVRRPWLPIGWSGLNLRRHRVTATAVSDGRLLSLPFTAFDDLRRRQPEVWAALVEFALRAAAPTLWIARGLEGPPGQPAPPPATELRPAHVDTHEVRGMYAQSAALGGLPVACHAWLAERTSTHAVRRDEPVLVEGRPSDGMWLLLNGRVRMTFDLAAEAPGAGQVEFAERTAVRAGTLLSLAGPAGGLPVPFDVTTTRVTLLAHVPLSALEELAELHPAWAGALVGQELWQLRNWLTWTRSRFGTDLGTDGIGAVGDLIADSSPTLPVNSALYGVPYLLRNPLTREDGFRRLYDTQLHAVAAERAVANTALDMLTDLERGHRFRVGMQRTYDAVVASEERSPHALRRVATRAFSDAMHHVPWVIEGLEHLPDDPNFILVYNHMAYAEDSVLPNGFLFNPDSHFVSSMLLEPHYGDGVRVARTNDRVEFWRSDYYERLGHIPVATPESGWIDETPEQKAARKQRFFDDCAAVLARGVPFSMAPEGTVTEEDSVTERSPGPLRAGAFLMSEQLPSRPAIVPVALANFDRPAHEAVFACVVRPAFRMADRGVDVEDRAAMQVFLEEYRREFRGHVEDAIALAREVVRPGADLAGLETNIGRVGLVHREFEPDVRALELRPRPPAPDEPTTVFYGSSTFRLWSGIGDDVGVPRAVNLGFGGSTLEACRLYFERVVLPHEPDRLVLYAGDNDIGRGESAEDVVQLFRQFADKVRTHCPTTRCWFVSIKPSPGRQEFSEAILAANAGVLELVEDDDQWDYVDWFRYLVDSDGTANRQLFEPDELHVNAAAYAVLGGLLREALRSS